MIEFENLKEELMEKSLTAPKYKDTSKLVLIRKDRLGKDGKIIHQGYWVDPTKEPIPHHVTVLANHHNLQDGHPQKVPFTDSNTVNPMASHTKDDVTIVADTYHDTFGTNAEFCEELKKRGVSWKENEDAKINLMRAKMALKTAIKNGFDPFKRAKFKPSVQPEPTETKKSDQPKMDLRTVVSNDSKKAATSFFETACNKDRNTFYSKLKEMGVKWTESENDGVNFMFAKRMLSLAIENGFDPNKPTPIVAPPPKPKSDTDESLLQVPDDAPERIKKLVEHINKMTDIGEIQGCTRVGIVPEDKRAKSYVLNKLQTRIAVAVMNPDNDEFFKDVDKDGKKKFPPELREQIKKSWGENLLEDLIRNRGFGKPTDLLYDKNSTGFGKAMADQLILDGCKKSPITEGFKQAANFDMEMLVNPRNKIANSGKTIRPGKILRSLNEGYADYTSDEHPTNMGYTGFSPAKYAERFSLEKEGTVKFLTKIKTENPQLKDKVDEMINTYGEAMKMVNHNPHVLNLILSSPNWTTYSEDNYKLTNFGKEIPQSYADAVRAVKFADHMSNLVITELEKRGYSQTSILDALKNVEINDCLRNFEIKNNDGGTDVIDFTQCKNPDGTNAVVVRRFEHEWGSGLLAYTQAKFMEKNNIPKNSVDPENLKAMENATDFYDMAKQMSEVTKDDYKKVHKTVLGMFGIKYVDADGNDLDYDNFNVSRGSWKTPGITRVKADENPETDVILANMIYGRFFHDINNEIAANVTNNAKSKMNDNGKDYSRNFDYYSGMLMKDYPERYSQVGNTEATYTRQELSNKINKQLSEVPNLSIDYISKLKTYYATTTKHPELDSFKSGWGRTTEAFLDNPLKDVMYQMAQNVSLHTPITVEKPTFSKLTAKRLNYTPFDFDSHTQGRLNKEKPKSVAKPTPQELKAARAALLQAAHCSLTAMAEKETREAWKKANEKFDYKKGETTLWGDTPMEPVHSIRDANGNVDYTTSVDPDTLTYNKVCLLNEPLFKINNSNFEENFKARQQKMVESGKYSPESYTPIDAFTGTSYWSGANLLGRDGAFYMGGELEKTGTLLGAGPYFSLTMGEAASYVGNESLSNQREFDRTGKKKQDLSREQADGLMILSKIMLGERFVKNAYSSDIKNPNLTFLAKEASSPDAVRQYVAEKRKGNKPGFSISKDVKLCGKDNDLILPEVIADTSSRVYALNVVYDPATGYHDPVTGELTHDKDGISVNIQWD